MQSVISIVGLAVGFTCFALASLWIRYEMTFDTFHKNADRLYTISTPSNHSDHGFERQNPYALAAYLKETFPEVSNACNIMTSGARDELHIDAIPCSILYAGVDSLFLSMFDISIIEGNSDFLIPGNKKMAISEKKSKELFGDKSPLGKELFVKDRSSDKTLSLGTIGAVVTGYSEHSNYPYDVLFPIAVLSEKWEVGFYGTLVELAPGVNASAFKKKLYEHEIKRGEKMVLSKIKMTSLTAIHYEDPNIKREVKFAHIVLFAFAGALVILCSLFNSLTLFVCRFKMREKEFALRIVAGASGRSLFSLWLVEFLMTLIPAFLLSLILIQITVSPFQKLSDIQMDLSSIYLESAVYIGTVIFISLMMFIGVLFLFRRKSLNVSIRKSNKNLFRKVSIVLQLLISIVFIFCTTVMIKQLYFLHHTDLGFTFKNTAAVIVIGNFMDLFENTKQIPVYSDLLENHFKQIPEITEIQKGYTPLMPALSQSMRRISKWDDKSSDMEGFDIQTMDISKQYAEFYGLQLKEGEMLSENELEENVLINESAVKFFGWERPIGKKIENYTVKGVIRNIYKSLPTIPVKPFIYYSSNQEYMSNRYVLFKYQEGKWEVCKSKIEELIKKENYENSTIYNAEEEYDKYLASENALLKLLSLLSLVCVIISVFGVFSMISLSCEERRKEIAIRKINGATMKDILSMYFKTYFSLLIIGAAIAFPVGYYIMKQWIEQYIKQTGIGVWIYLSIIFVMAFVIILCVGWRVYKASVENPAEVIKN
jgi:ABC-type antimicrobial peptide transport system permease subunit